MKRSTLMAIVLVVAVALAGCGLTLGAKGLPAANPAAASVEPTTSAVSSASYQAAAPTASAAVAVVDVNSAVAALETAFQQIYANVTESVVQIQVVAQASSGAFSPFGQNNGRQQGLGSGFVWDKNGNIVTNNHVIENATSITVLFSDGSTAPAKVVGADSQTDLAVIKVDVAAAKLKPVTVGDSTKIKVGQFAIAIGNPYGEQNTMTTGIISAIGRFLPVDSTSVSGSYTIPDVIQTDAAINPGNSGGVLLDINGSVIGVTSAIESNSGSSAGIGFAIPTEVVRRVVPALISTGKFEHPYLGISGTSLTTDLAKAMDLNDAQRGALVASVTANGPAAQAGLQGSTKTVTINGGQAEVGGDVITAINGEKIETFNDLVAYLALSTKVGEKVDVTILRNGKQQTVSVTLGSRPTTSPQATTSQNSNPFQNAPNQGQGNTSGSAYLGISGTTLTQGIAQAMNLPTNQTGVLVQQVQPGSPAASAGLRASSKSATVNGQTVQVGGDVIVALGRQQITSMQDLTSLLAQMQPGQRTTLTVLRDGQQTRLSVTLGEVAATTTP